MIRRSGIDADVGAADWPAATTIESEATRSRMIMRGTLALYAYASAPVSTCVYDRHLGFEAQEARDSVSALRRSEIVRGRMADRPRPLGGRCRRSSRAIRRSLDGPFEGSAARGHSTAT